MKNNISKKMLGISAAVFTVIVFVFCRDNLMCIGAAILVCANFGLTEFLKFAYGLVIKKEKITPEEAEKILSVTDMELLLLSVPMFIVPIFFKEFSNILYVVYINIVGAVLLITVLLGNSKE